MRFREKVICPVCLIGAAALLISAGSQLDFINTQRAEMKLISNEPLENAPPALAFATVAMGAFRGLVVDVLWIRAENLKEDGQFFDAKQLADWITTLQPRFAQVWEMQAWNMAYNISAAIPASQPEERWRWVKNGYELLRDKGIPLNPRSILLYHELARIFQHKIGGVSDDDHKYYKIQLATAMEMVLKDADYEFFEALVKAPKTWEEIISDSGVAGFVGALKSADEAFADDAAFVNNYLSLRQNAARFKAEAGRVIDDFRGSATLEKFDVFARAYYLRHTWKMEPALMQKINEMYGPTDFSDPNHVLSLDWRHPSCHGIYWAVKGLEAASRDTYSMAEANTDRMVNFCLQDLFRYGKMFFYVSPTHAGDSALAYDESEIQSIYLRPDLRMFDAYEKSSLKVIHKYDILRSGTYEAALAGHRNMLDNAVESFYQAGHIPYARKIYRKLQEMYPEREEFSLPLEEFVRARWKTALKDMTITNAQESITGMLCESYFRYAMRDDETAAALEKMAEGVHEYYNSLYPDETTRIDLPDFKLMRYFSLRDFFNDEQYPLNMRQSLIARIELERPDIAEQLKETDTKVNEMAAEAEQGK